MSQIILDEQLTKRRVLIPIARWAKVTKISDLRPNEIVKDERIPSLLRHFKQPTFVTIDAGFWNKNLRDSAYCIIYFAFQKEEEAQIPDLLRHLLKLAEFRTRAVRMGKVVRVSTAQIEYWQGGDEQLHRLAWFEPQIKKDKR